MGPSRSTDLAVGERHTSVLTSRKTDSAADLLVNKPSASKPYILFLNPVGSIPVRWKNLARFTGSTASTRGP